MLRFAPLARAGLRTAPRRAFLRPQSLHYSVTTGGEKVDAKIDNLTIDQYHKKADEYLESMVEQLEALGETFRDLDVEYSDGVLNMELPPLGQYCINKQPPNKQIWLASPVSGPNRYDLVQGKWVSLRDQSSLTKVLEKEVREASGQPFEFELD